METRHFASRRDATLGLNRSHGSRIKVLLKHICAVIAHMLIPRSQGELIRTVRGKRSQSEFARALGCDRSCLSRYENESLGAPTSVINFCLQAIAQDIPEQIAMGLPIEAAIRHAKEVVFALERMKTLNPERVCVGANRILATCAN